MCLCVVWKIDGKADTLMPIVNIDNIELFTRSAQGEILSDRVKEVVFILDCLIETVEAQQKGWT